MVSILNAEHTSWCRILSNLLRRNIADEDRIDFVRAVECLMDTESLHDDIDGARSRFDDFGVLHYELTPFVHLSASFLLFHRYYIWAYEEALRTECSYEGDTPASPSSVDATRV